jgi:hypothetical protein
MTEHSAITADPTIEDLARAADDAGARLADGVNDLADRLAPRQLADDALALVRGRGGALARGAGVAITGAVKAHPLVTAAAVGAVALAVVAGRRIATAELDIDRDLDGYTDYDDTALTGAALADGAAATADAARDLVAENPLVAILGGLAAGAALAMLFPASDAERRSLGALARRAIGG